MSRDTQEEADGWQAGPPRVTSLSELVQRAQGLARKRARTLLGITGAPGVGKSTLANEIVTRIGTTACLVEMDGFHLSRARLAELGRLERMGAIDTFDASGFVGLTRTLRAASGETVYAPRFRRDIEVSIEDAHSIEASVALVVIEGNYLLVPDEPWGQLRELFDEIWYCERDEQARVAGLVARHRMYGKTEGEALRWALGSDQRNAELIETTRARADIITKLDGQLTDGERARFPAWRCR